MEVLALAVMTRSKVANQNSLAIENTLSEDFPHLFKLDRIIKIIIKDTKEVKVLPQKLKHETKKLSFQTKDGVEPERSQLKEIGRDLKFLMY